MLTSLTTVSPIPCLGCTSSHHSDQSTLQFTVSGLRSYQDRAVPHNPGLFLTTRVHQIVSRRWVFISALTQSLPDLTSQKGTICRVRPVKVRAYHPAYYSGQTHELRRYFRVSLSRLATRFTKRLRLTETVKSFDIQAFVRLFEHIVTGDQASTSRHRGYPYPPGAANRSYIAR